MSENPMAGNPHYSPHLPDTAATCDGRAVAAATLALAYEQRTACLIALAAAQWADGSSMFAGVNGKLTQIIKERLDLA